MALTACSTIALQGVSDESTIPGVDEFSVCGIPCPAGQISRCLIQIKETPHIAVRGGASSAGVWGGYYPGAGTGFMTPSLRLQYIDEYLVRGELVGIGVVVAAGKHRPGRIRAIEFQGQRAQEVVEVGI